ncbi:MAG: nuclease, partial [Nocardioides sp.]|nr:nuclease [Nocardioides sp.]
MTARARPPAEHVVSRAVATMRTEVGGVAQAALWSMSPAEAAATLIEVTRLSAQVAELALRVAAHAETVQVGDVTGAVSTGAWWAHQTQQTRLATARSMHLAVALAGPRQRVRAAL